MSTLPVPPIKDGTKETQMPNRNKLRDIRYILLISSPLFFSVRLYYVLAAILYFESDSVQTGRNCALSIVLLEKHDFELNLKTLNFTQKLKILRYFLHTDLNDDVFVFVDFVFSAIMESR